MAVDSHWFHLALVVLFIQVVAALMSRKRLDSTYS